MYDPAQIHTSRLTHSTFYKLTRDIYSDFGIQVLVEMLHSFISLMMFVYVGMTGRSNPHITDCEEDGNCVRFVTNFCLAALCITKFVVIPSATWSVTKYL
jgi:hypothetical protein